MPRPSLLAQSFALGWLLGGCSLHSLDYLEAGGGGLAGVSGGGSSAGAAASGASASVGGASSGSSNEGGEPSSGGSSGPGGGSGGEVASPPDCTDSLTTSDETDVDCGGRTCAPCTADQACVTGTDCESAICTNQVCQAPSCYDLALNGDESDKNCGGSCPKCAAGMHCDADEDCATGKCQDGMCVSATCVEGVLASGCPLLVDNTPYSFSPSHAPSKCLDDSALSVENGTPMLIWGCRQELQQTFWAVDHLDGFFALRSAISGKCLQVRGSSEVDGAFIEQFTCDFTPSQLWKPVRVDDALMRLSSQLTGFYLDVAGNNVASDGQEVTQSEAGDSADTRWRVTKRTAASYVTFSPYANKAVRIRHDDSTAEVTTADDEDSHWKVVPGLYDASLVSFQARDDPGRYLRHAAWRLWADNNDGSTQFMRDATFRFRNPLVGSNLLSKSFESINYPGYFWVREGSTAALRQQQDSAAFKESATWWLVER
ncbi:MAG: hypothetical protein EOO73_15530 [Myxococcales bacterium]|nr:MAG: hypothetical protein EOO73_15530 [Myxococcales bacterium]